jgi:uncharacterized membrane protein
MSREAASLEILIGRLLLTGVSVATLCLGLGLAAAAVAPAASWWLLNAGLIILIATPAARVVLSIVEYASERDWTFAALSAVVLLELIAGAVAAIVFHRAL